MRNAQRTVKQLSERLNESTHIFTTYAQVSNLQLKFMQQSVRNRHDPIDKLGLVLYRVRAKMSDASEHELGEVVRFHANGRIPLYHFLGLKKSEGLSQSDLENNLQQRMLLDLLAGTRLCNEGCVVLPPYVSVLFATKEPSFIPNGSLLANLRFGCGETVPESVVWSVCDQLGLPHISKHIANMPMMNVLSKATTSQIQMLSLARAILCKPDVLLVDDFELDATYHFILKRVLFNFVQGVPITKLGQPCASMRAGQVDSVERLLSAAGSYDDPINYDDEQISLEKRTVIWHSTAAHLKAAGADAFVETRDDEVKLYRCGDGKLDLDLMDSPVPPLSRPTPGSRPRFSCGGVLGGNATPPVSKAASVSSEPSTSSVQMGWLTKMEGSGSVSPRGIRTEPDAPPPPAAPRADEVDAAMSMLSGPPQSVRRRSTLTSPPAFPIAATAAAAPMAPPPSSAAAAYMDALAAATAAAPPPADEEQEEGGRLRV